jgi:hypothetical protein
VKPIFLLGFYECIFHGTGNSAQLCQNFGIWEGVEPFNPPPLGTPQPANESKTSFEVSEQNYSHCVKTQKNIISFYVVSPVEDLQRVTNLGYDAI